MAARRPCAGINSTRMRRVSTLGLRADTEWQVSAGTTVALRSELGWQHQYGGLERGTGLRFNGGNAPFVVDSVPVSRDGMVLKAGRKWR